MNLKDGWEHGENEVQQSTIKHHMAKFGCPNCSTVSSGGDILGPNWAPDLGKQAPLRKTTFPISQTFKIRASLFLPKLTPMSGSPEGWHRKTDSFWSYLLDMLQLDSLLLFIWAPKEKSLKPQGSSSPLQALCVCAVFQRDTTRFFQFPGFLLQSFGDGPHLFPTEKNIDLWFSSKYFRVCGLLPSWSHEKLRQGTLYWDSHYIDFPSPDDFQLLVVRKYSGGAQKKWYSRCRSMWKFSWQIRHESISKCFFWEKRVFQHFQMMMKSILISPMFERHSEGEWQIPELSNRLGKFRNHGLLMVAGFLLSL